MTNFARFLVAGAIPFLCIFSQTLLQYNGMFALGGMVSRPFFPASLMFHLFNFVQVNHTLADWETLEQWEAKIKSVLIKELLCSRDDDLLLLRWASDLPWLELSLRWTPALMAGASSWSCWLWMRMVMIW